MNVGNIVFICFWGLYLIVVIVFLINRKRISSCLKIDWSNSTFCQSISNEFRKKYHFKNNYDQEKKFISKEFLSNLKFERDKNLEDLRQFLILNRKKCFKIKTHDGILIKLRKFETDGIIIIKIIKDYGEKRQIIERIGLVGFYTFKKNLGNESFRDHIKKEIHLAKYEIKVL